MSDISVATSQTRSAMTAARSSLSANRLSGMDPNSAPRTSKNLERIEKTAKDFEAVFITEMLKPMFNMIEVDPVFGGGKGEEVFRDFTLNEYGKQLSQKGGFGIADAVKQQLLHMQESGSGNKLPA